MFVGNEDYVFEFLEYIDQMIGGYPGNEDIHAEILKILADRVNYSIDLLDKLIASMKKRLKFLKGIETDIPLDELGSYGCLFVQALLILIFFVRRDSSFSIPFYFTYEPANITNRISNQSSIFIYQLYGINEIRQGIHPDFIIKISNKMEFLEDLDCLGINEQFIFNDYDHIAAYIKNKYIKLSDEHSQTFFKLKQLNSTNLRGNDKNLK